MITKLLLDYYMQYQQAADLARELLHELKEKEFDKYAELKSGSGKQLDTVKQFKHYHECCEVLEAIASQQCNIPCGVGGGCPTFSCDILVCCRTNGFRGCWECKESEDCEKFELLESIHGDSPKYNIKQIRELGLDKWVEQRSKPYIWQQ
jgi:hypothetical protein